MNRIIDIQRLSPQVRRYVVVGISVYILELIIIFSAQALGASSVVAVSLSFWIGLLASFIIQKFFTFGDTRTQHRILLSQVVAFSLLVLFNFGFTVMLTRLLSDVIPAPVCRTLALAITTLWNFYLYKTHLFRNQAGKID